MDLNEVFALAVKLETIKVIIAIKSYRGWSMFHLNINPVFLNEPLEEEKTIGFELKAKV